MKRIAVVIISTLCLVISTQILAAHLLPKLNATGGCIDDFIPRDWKIIKQASGDLNKDEYDDLVGVIEYKEGKTGDLEAPPRILFIAFQHEQGGYQYLKLSVQTEKAILRSDDGGVWGDPFEDISINRGSILISFYGGSNWRWSNRYRFRFQDGGWYLIGATTSSQFTGTGEGEEKDFNLLTGKMIKKTTDKKGNVKVETINRGRKKLVSLVGFDVYTADEQY